MRYTVDVVIFDFDGVLVDTGLDIANAMNFVLREFGLAELPAQTIIGFIGRGAGNLVLDCLGQEHAGLLDQALPIFIERYSRYHLVDTCLYAGVKEVLGSLRQAGVILAIATQKPEPITHAILSGLAIDTYIFLVVGPESITHRKPHPESITRVIQSVQADPRRVIMVGDMPTDIQAGKAAGALTCAVTYGLGKAADLEAAGPDFIIDEIKDLLVCIEERSERFPQR
jgi:phosphoglycolate phosphatase